MFLDIINTPTRISVVEQTLSSAILGREVALILYLPENENLRQLPHLLLLNDGQDLPPMQFEQILQCLYQKDQLQPVLVVGIKAGNRLQEYGISGQPDFKGRGAEAEIYRHFITQELLPALTQYTPYSRFASHAVAGFSLGALSALDIAWHHPELFSRVGAFSGSFWWRTKDLNNGYTNQDRIAHQLVRTSTHRPDLKFWMMAGTQDEKSDRDQNGIIDSIDDTTSLIYELYNRGYGRNQINYAELVGGKHDIGTWGRIMPKFLLWAFGKYTQQLHSGT